MKEKKKKVTGAVTNFPRCAESVNRRTAFLHPVVLVQKDQERYL